MNEWWRGAIIYQIYPRSFLDTNGDGIGDLNGITQKLDYVASLGVDGVWISPFFKSPMDDFGYDVSDYRCVDPIFGDLEDFDELLERAHDLGLKLIIDQVYSHTSSQHAWFEESRQSRDNPKADWYVWADAKVDGTPPNNWQSAFGSAAWTWDSRRQQYYLHNFVSSQPDLNLHNTEVQDELLDVARFWLDRGVDGFRLDAINFAMHDLRLRDNPPAPPDVRSEARPYFMQLLKYNMDHGDVPKLLGRLREVTDAYADVLTVAEVGGHSPLQTMQSYTHGESRLNTAYSFDFLSTTDLVAGRVRDILGGWSGKDEEGWPSWAFSNHDAPRVASRWGAEVEHSQRVRLIALLQICLRGNMFLYQGEELGLTQANVPFEKLQDPDALANWPNTLGRDGARTPMPWVCDGEQAGFSSVDPWLPIDSAHNFLAADLQQDDPESTLNFFRHVISIRKASPALTCGDLEIVDAPQDLLVFTRRGQDELVYCVFNLGSETVNWTPGEGEPMKLRVGVGQCCQEGEPPMSVGSFCAYVAFAKV